MATAVLQVLRTRLLTIGIGTALAVGLMVSATGAEARMSASEMANDFACALIQEQYDDAYNWWSETSLVGPDSNPAWAELTYWRDEWNSSGCAEKYGSLGRLAPPRVTSITSANITAGTTPKQGSR